MQPRVIVSPWFRRMDEIFDRATLERLHGSYDVIWGRDAEMPSELFSAELRSADAVVFGTWPTESAPVENSGDRLRALLEVAGGHEHVGIDYRECLERGLYVGSCAPAFAPAVAEMALALALAVRRGVAAADRRMRNATELWLHDENRDNASLLGAVVGFVGCGGISSRLQDLLVPFGVEILGYDPPIHDEDLFDRGVVPTDLESIFDRADVVFVLAAPTPDNRGLVSAGLMERLDERQTLVLVSRAHLVDFDALTAFVSAGRFRAALDVYPVEPLPVDHPIRRVEHAICTPHIAGALPSTLHRIGELVVDDLDAIFDDRTPERMQYLTVANYDGLVQTPSGEQR